MTDRARDNQKIGKKENELIDTVRQTKTRERERERERERLRGRERERETETETETTGYHNNPKSQHVTSPRTTRTRVSTKTLHVFWPISYRCLPRLSH